MNITVAFVELILAEKQRDVAEVLVEVVVRYSTPRCRLIECVIDKTTHNLTCCHSRRVSGLVALILWKFRVVPYKQMKDLICERDKRTPLHVACAGTRSRPLCSYLKVPDGLFIEQLLESGCNVNALTVPVLTLLCTWLVVMASQQLFVEFFHKIVVIR